MDRNSLVKHSRRDTKQVRYLDVKLDVREAATWLQMKKKFGSATI